MSVFIQTPRSDVLPKLGGSPPHNRSTNERITAGDVLVRGLEESDQEKWDAFVRRHPSGTPFHLQAWRKVIEDSFPYRQSYLIAHREDQVRGVLPMFHVENILVKKALISVPFAVYGGILADSEEVRKALYDAAIALGRRLGVEYIELRNACREQCVTAPNVHRYVTFTQEIGRDENAVLESIPRKTRHMVRKSLKQGFDSGATRDPRRFEDLYSANLHRLGTPCFPHKYFEALLRHYGDAVDIREYELNGQLVSAVMTFYFGDQVLPYYGASDPKFNALAPNNFMYFDLMRRSGQNGYRLFDFGRSKKETGSYEFKAHWGMSERELPYELILLKGKDLPNVSPANPKYRLAIGIWRNLPLAITRMVGPRLLRLVP